MESWFSGKRDLYTLLQNFGDSESTDPRDLVPALLGISMGAVQAIRPDYEKSEAQVIETVSTFSLSCEDQPCSLIRAG